MKGSLIETAALCFDADGTPVSDIYGDVYHSVAGGHTQAQHVFLTGNDLPARWQGRERFVILETGFGLGVNFLATWLAWKNDPLACHELHYISLEKHPFSAADLARAHRAWPEFTGIAAELNDRWPLLTPGLHRIRLASGRLMLTLAFGEALGMLPSLEVMAQAFYLDGFSPAKNPELWSSELCHLLAQRADCGATLATWSVAGSVRRALRDAGFLVEKRPGFAGKRQMLTARFGGN